MKKRTFKLFNTDPLLLETRVLSIKANTNLKTGVIKNTILFMGPKVVRELVNNFTASAAGCKSPHAPTLLGPTRI